MALEKNGHQHAQDKRIEALELAVGQNRAVLARAIGVGVGVSAMVGLFLLMINFILTEKSNAFQAHETRLDQNERVIIGHVERAQQEHNGYESALSAIKARHEKDMDRVSRDYDKLERRVNRR